MGHMTNKIRDKIRAFEAGSLLKNKNSEPQVNLPYSHIKRVQWISKQL